MAVLLVEETVVLFEVLEMLVESAEEREGKTGHRASKQGRGLMARWENTFPIGQSI